MLYRKKLTYNEVALCFSSPLPLSSLFQEIFIMYPHVPQTILGLEVKLLNKMYKDFVGTALKILDGTGQKIDK